MDPQDWLKKLDADHARERRDLELYNSHFEGTMPLAYLHPELLAELDERIQQVVIAWPELVIDCLDERLDLEAFRISGTAKSDDGLGEIWQYNDLDEYSQQAHVEALVMRRSFAIVGTRDEGGDVPADIPLITVESPLQVHAEWDPRTRQVVAARKFWKADGPDGTKVEHSTLYLPDSTAWYVKDGAEWVPDEEHEPDEHKLGVVPVVPIVNRPRIRCPGGKSELASIIPVSSAANKIATDMMVSAEYHAMPRRVAYGFGQEDFEDENGNRVSAWSRVAGRIWATEKTKTEGAEVEQFSEANLRNFHDTINLLAHIVSALGALPPAFMGFATQNPASADAIRSSESRLVKRAERRQHAFGNAWERVMRLADRIQTGDWRPELRRLEAVWRDASTPTVAQSADAAVKKHQAGIVPLRQTREDLGYNDEQIKLMEQEDEKAALRDPINQIARDLSERGADGPVDDRAGQDPDATEDEVGAAGGGPQPVATNR